MFYVLLSSSVPFAAHPPAVVDECADVHGVKAMLARVQIAHPNEELIVVEFSFRVGAAMPAIPPELARAAATWNALTRMRKPYFARIRSLGNYVGPFRKWKTKNSDRNYLLEDVVAAAERRRAEFPWLFFGWLLRVTPDGTLNSDKIVHGNAFSKTERTVIDSGNTGNQFDDEKRRADFDKWLKGEHA